MQKEDFESIAVKKSDKLLFKKLKDFQIKDYEFFHKILKYWIDMHNGN